MWLTRRIRLAGVNYLFCDPRAPAPERARRLRPTQLRRLLAEHGSAPALKRLAAELGAGRPERARHARGRGAGRGAGLEALSELTCYALPSPIPHLTPGPIPNQPALVEPPPQAPLPMFDEERHWVEIQLLGEDDEGVAGVLCEITLASGKIIRRSTDGHGLVRVEGVTDASNCSVRFPALDADAWAPA